VGSAQDQQTRVAARHLQLLFWDADENCWEILSNPTGGYGWLFGVGDQKTGKGHLDKNFKRPGVNL
jgi:hypothetical protein